MNLIEATCVWVATYGKGVTAAFMCCAFFLGASLASAINCFMYRRIRGMSWVHGHSFCQECGHILRPLELIPVFSCLILRGRCKSCGFKFGYFHAMTELLAGTAALVCFTCGVGNVVWQNIAYAVIYLALYVMLSATHASYVYNSKTYKDSA